MGEEAPGGEDRPPTVQTGVHETGEPSVGGMVFVILVIENLLKMCILPALKFLASNPFSSLPPSSSLALSLSSTFHLLPLLFLLFLLLLLLLLLLPPSPPPPPPPPSSSSSSSLLLLLPPPSSSSTERTASGGSDEPAEQKGRE